MRGRERVAHTVMPDVRHALDWHGTGHLLSPRTPFGSRAMLNDTNVGCGLRDAGRRDCRQWASLVRKKSAKSPQEFGESHE